MARQKLKILQITETDNIASMLSKITQAPYFQEKNWRFLVKKAFIVWFES